MKRRTKRIIGAIVVIAAIAAGGAAFTASNTVPDTVAGYGTSNITGATVTALHYTLNGDGTEITDASLTFHGDQTGNVVKAGFGSDSLTDVHPRLVRLRDRHDARVVHRLHAVDGHVGHLQRGGHQLIAPLELAIGRAR